MKSIACTFILLITQCILYAQLPNVSAGKIIRIENFSSNYVDARTVDIWLPENYNAEKKYAVLYMHDGQMLFDSTTTWNHQEWGVDETIGKLISEKKMKDCIVVAIWNNGEKRYQEYFPQKPFFTIDKKDREKWIQIAGSNERIMPETGPISDQYLLFLVKELKPYIDKTYSTLSTQENTFIAGSSMGGLISMYAICEFPEVFGGAACLSTHWPGIFISNDEIPDAFFHYLKKHLPSPKNHVFYFDFGTETLDSLYEPYQIKVDKIMQRKKYDSHHWITKKFVGDDHSEKSWRKRLEIPITFLLGKKT